MDPQINKLNFNNWYTICKSNIDQLFSLLLEYCANNDSNMIRKENYSEFVKLCYNYSPLNKDCYNYI